MRREKHPGMQKLKEAFISGSASPWSWPLWSLACNTGHTLVPPSPTVCPVFSPVHKHGQHILPPPSVTVFAHLMPLAWSTLLSSSAWQTPDHSSRLRSMFCRCRPATDHPEPAVVKRGGFATHLEKENTGDSECEQRAPARAYYTGFELHLVIGRRA